MTCNCSNYSVLALDRKSINKRIKESKIIVKQLVLIAEGGPLQLRLLQCPKCGQYWQTGREWNFGNGEYLFHVPSISANEWLEEPYTQPAAWALYMAMMENYLAKNSFESGEKPCRVAGCALPATKLSGVCAPHHIEQLQRFGLLPVRPTGRLFAPFQ